MFIPSNKPSYGHRTSWISVLVRHESGVCNIGVIELPYTWALEPWFFQADLFCKPSAKSQTEHFDFDVDKRSTSGLIGRKSFLKYEYRIAGGVMLYLQAWNNKASKSRTMRGGGSSMNVADYQLRQSISNEATKNTSSREQIISM